MCNDYGHRVSYREYVEAFGQLKLPLHFPRGAPNLEPREDIRPTEMAPVIKGAVGGGGEFATLRWGFPSAKPKGPPVINFRSDGRRFDNGRCLIPASHFFEFTGDKYPKTKWRFTVTGEDWFCIAGLWRKVETADGEVEAFTLLTCPPGADIAPYHDRQVVILERRHWGAWLDLDRPAEPRFEPAPEGTFAAEEVVRG
jgi:putative SOS response-associated peptidase YedK